MRSTTRWLWVAAAAGALAGCAANGALEGHNHPADAAVNEPADEIPGRDLDVWRLNVAGAT